jgi:hypothetical protein
MRLGGAPARTRQRDAGGTIQQYFAALQARHGWAPTTGNDILSPFLMAQPQVQAVLAQINAMPADGPAAQHEAQEAAARSRQLIASFASRYREAPPIFNAMHMSWNVTGRRMARSTKSRVIGYDARQAAVG